MSELYDDLPHVYRYDADSPNYNFFDFGFTDPWVCLDVQKRECKIKGSDCPYDMWFIWREYYVPGFTPEKHVDNLKGRKNPGGFRIDCGFADYAGAGDISILRSQWCPIVAEVEAKQDYRRGFAEIQTLLEPVDCTGPHLLLDPSCINTIREFGSYKEPKRNDPEKSSTGKPEFKNDHSMDALRYGFMHLRVLFAGQHWAPSGDAYNRTGDIARAWVPQDKWIEGDMRLPVEPIFSTRGHIF